MTKFARPPGLVGPLALVGGTVSVFDDAAGLGTLDVAGYGPVPFHCTAIADGSRSIAIGTQVVAILAARHLGRFEAGAITPLATQADGPELMEASGAPGRVAR